MSETFVRCQQGRLSWGRDCQAGDKAGGGRNAHPGQPGPALPPRAPPAAAPAPAPALHLTCTCTSRRTALHRTGQPRALDGAGQAGRSRRPHFFPSIEGGAFQFLPSPQTPRQEGTMRAGMRRQAPRRHRMLQVKMPEAPSFAHPALQKSPHSLSLAAGSSSRRLGLAGPGLTRPALA